MRELYEAEMRLLHEAAQEFARAYPEQAGMLNLQEVRDRDPHVERLLQGMAYLTAQVRRRIDDDVPEFSEALLEQLWPHILRPFPSTCIVQFTPRPGQLQQAHPLDKGIALMSAPVGDDRVICRFRTTAEVTLYPLRVQEATMEEGAAGSRLRLVFRMDAGVAAGAVGLRELKLFLHADPQVALNLHHALTGRARSVTVRFPQNPETPPQRIGGQERLRPAHLEVSELLTPSAGRSFPGFHLLQEYFACRDKFLFVLLDGLDTVRWPNQCTGFEIEVALQGEYDGESPRKENFRLFCAPAVNLYSGASEPVALTHRRSDYPVIADAAAREGVEIYSVDAVTGIEMKTGKRREYRPLPAFRREDGRYFQISRRQDADRPRPVISVGGKIDGGHESLSCAVTATNGDYPRRYLQEKALSVPSSELPSWILSGNITRPGRMLRPPRRKDYRLALISHLSLHFGTLAQPEAFRGMLSLYDWTGQEQNRRRIEGIRQVEVNPVDRIVRGALLRGLEVELTVHEDHYLSLADIHLFGLVLHQFLGMYAPLNTFIETRIVCHPSRRTLVWKPRLGETFQL